MRFAIQYYGEDSRLGTFTIEGSTYTTTFAIAKVRCQRYGVRFLRIEAAPGHPERTLRDALEQAQEEPLPFVRPGDFDSLMDIALLIKDEAWFDSLRNRKEMKNAAGG